MRARDVLRTCLLVFVLCVGGVSAEVTSEANDSTLAPLSPPTVSFTIDFPAANPSHYVITIAHDGRGNYISNGALGDSAPADSSESPSSDSPPATKSSAPDNAALEFTTSDRVRDQVFDLAQRAHYFSGKVDSGRKNIANTGSKILAYKDGQHDGQAIYNYSNMAPIQQLTAIFQQLSETLEFGRRLSFFHKYQKTALDDDLKRMEELQKDKSLGDVQAIAPVLKEIANDQSVMNVARARALRLLAQGVR